MPQNSSPTLPPPDSQSAAHCDRVSEFVRQRIAEAGGSISFAEYMQHALYAPGLGYYAAGTTKFGEAGDFVTAPEVSSVFGKVVARQCAEVLAGTSNGSILEIGAGSGKLAVDVLEALDAMSALPQTYRILEVSADLQERQQRLLEERVPHVVDRVEWLATLPDGHRGVILANEVLDAMPVERFAVHDTGLHQQRVTHDGSGFTTVEAPAGELLQAALGGIEADLGIEFATGFASEVCLAAPQWIGDLAGSLSEGVALLFDYGVTRREYYAADRSDGWLRCHFRHHAHNNPLILTGIQDITAWVDFTAIAEAAVAAGLEIGGYTAQAQFLISGGLPDVIRESGDRSMPEQLQLSQEVKTLTLPGDMGEHFKCMALRQGEVPVPSAFALADRTHTL